MPEEIRNAITKTFNDKPILKDIEADQDFFDLGASSLTVVDLQIQIEKLLDLAVETSKLMAMPTLNGWVEAYTAQKSA
jgi:acyl carrier protein